MFGSLFNGLKCLLLVFLILGLPIFFNTGYRYFTFSRAEEIKKDGGHYHVLKDGRYLEYFTMGDPEKPVVIFIPGFLTTGKMIESLVSENTIGEYYFLGVSLPGFGGSSRNPDRQIRDFPLDIASLLHHLGMEDREIFIAGTSFGGLHANAFICGVDHGINIRQVQFLCAEAPGNEVANNQGVSLSSFERLGYRTIHHVIGVFSYLFPKFVSSLIGRKDCFRNIDDKVDFMFSDMARCGKFTTKGYLDNFMEMFKPLDIEKCEEKVLEKLKEEKGIFFTHTEKDTICGREHLDWYLNRYNIDEHDDILVKEPNEGNCYCVRNFEDLFLRGTSLLPS